MTTTPPTDGLADAGRLHPTQTVTPGDFSTRRCSAVRSVNIVAKGGTHLPVLRGNPLAAHTTGGRSRTTIRAIVHVAGVRATVIAHPLIQLIPHRRRCGRRNNSADTAQPRRLAGIRSGNNREGQHCNYINHSQLHDAHSSREGNEREGKGREGKGREGKGPRDPGTASRQATFRNALRG